MRRLAWLTDIHLNFAEPGAFDGLSRAILQSGADAVLLGGDIGEAPDVEEYLLELDRRLGLPLYFVLGNHDFYLGSIAGVRARVADLCRRSDRLSWLPAAGVVALSPGTALVGHDGWADGRLGDYEHSGVTLSDYRFIAELTDLGAGERLGRLQALGDEAAAHFRAVLPAALARFPRVIVLTHVPPFREACRYLDRVANDDYLPHFACKAVGDVLAEAAAAHPGCQVTVLWSHTHSPSEAVILPNLRVVTGGAEYGEPSVQRLLDVD